MGKEYFGGVDAGSTYTKAAVIDSKGNLIATTSDMTGVNIISATTRLYHDVLSKAGLSEDQVGFVVGTGYGRYKITFGNTQVTEISCHAKGAHVLFPETRTVLDMGGQDTKAIRINARGEVVDFTMNDKCAAGTGRFIEGSARALNLSLKDVGDISLKSTNPVKISATCAVFAESETQEQLAWGNSLQDILYGIHASMASKSIGLLRRVGIEPELTFTGGVSLNQGMVRCLQEQLGMKINTDKLTMFCGAIGAAHFALEKSMVTVRAGG
ncbi:MAG: 2-hydroxyglutaryl-CoA dehydratase [Nitrososphaerota archaeon]|nr:2-hydroxyglutaryl-CoA dehydratase [Nitrososphaerota archaeon]